MKHCEIKDLQDYKIYKSEMYKKWYAAHREEKIAYGKEYYRRKKKLKK